MKDNPLISIYMPTWNRQQLAIRAIKSVLRQDYNNWEMIIVDDCSTSWEQLQQYVTALNDPRITYIHNDINSGGAREMKTVIKRTRFWETAVTIWYVWRRHFWC